jgi:hypothetical protein
MVTVETVFETFGGPTAVANAIGVKPSTASEMRRRASIPVRYWPALVMAANEQGFAINNDALVKMHSQSEGEAA